MVNRLIGSQIIKSSNIILEQSKLGWYVINILTCKDINKVDNAMLKIQFSKLTGDGISKWIIVDKDATVVKFAENTKIKLIN
jgi:propanediol dehydratase large subunit